MLREKEYGARKEKVLDSGLNFVTLTIKDEFKRMM